MALSTEEGATRSCATDNGQRTTDNERLTGMRIALAQINTTVGDFAGNVDRILRFARRAVERQADLVVFHELALCGYPPRDLVEKPEFIRRTEAELERLAGLLPDIPTLVGYVRRSDAKQGKAVADAAALLHGKRMALDYAKILLAFYDVFDESRYFEPGNAPAVYKFGALNVGVTICEDIWNDKYFWERQLYARSGGRIRGGRRPNLAEHRLLPL